MPVGPGPGCSPVFKLTPIAELGMMHLLPGVARAGVIPKIDCAGAVSFDEGAIHVVIR